MVQLAVAVINAIAKSSLERRGSCGTEGIQCGNRGGMQLLALFIAHFLSYSPGLPVQERHRPQWTGPSKINH